MCRMTSGYLSNFMGTKGSVFLRPVRLLEASSVALVFVLGAQILPTPQSAAAAAAPSVAPLTSNTSALIWLAELH